MTLTLSKLKSYLIVWSQVKKYFFYVNVNGKFFFAIKGQRKVIFSASVAQLDKPYAAWLRAADTSLNLTCGPFATSPPPSSSSLYLSNKAQNILELFSLSLNCQSLGEHFFFS